jgi:hypothetical protein
MIWAGRSGGLVEDSLTLDLAQVMRLGPVRDGQRGLGSLSWRLDGEAIGSAWFRIDLRSIDAARLVIVFALAGVDGRRPRIVRQSIRLGFTVPQFGGRRWWMLCPVTGSRVRCLHLSPHGDRFASREALGLAYRVERLGRFDRPFEKVFRAQQRLGGSVGWGAEIARPKGMWSRTYCSRLERLAALDADCCAAVAWLLGSAPEGKVRLPRKGAPS